MGGIFRSHFPLGGSRDPRFGVTLSGLASLDHGPIVLSVTLYFSSHQFRERADLSQCLDLYSLLNAFICP